MKLFRLYSKSPSYLGSLYFSWKLSTYPSPKPTLTLRGGVGGQFPRKVQWCMIRLESCEVRLELRKTGGGDRVQRYLAVPVLKWTQHLVISRRNCAGTAKNCTKKHEARVEWLFCSQNLVCFRRSRCRSCRSFIRSLLLTRRRIILHRDSTVAFCLYRPIKPCFYREYPRKRLTVESIDSQQTNKYFLKLKNRV